MRIKFNKAKLIIWFIFSFAIVQFLNSNAAFSEQSGIQNDFLYINLEKARQLFDKDVLFIDIRSGTEYHKSHILGAINISIEELDQDLLDIFYQNYRLWEMCPCKHNQLKDISKVECVVYGSGSNSDNAVLHIVARKLMEYNFKNIYIFSDGFISWYNTGYDIYNL